MLPRTTLLTACCIALTAFAQDGTLIRTGSAFTKTAKGLTGDLHLTVNGGLDASGQPIVFAQEGSGYKVARLNSALQPAEELSLVQQSFDGAKWDAVTCANTANGMRILFVSNTKKNADFGVGTLNTNGALSIVDFHKVVSFPHPCPFDPSVTTCKKTLPDLILFDNGAAYDQSDRLIASPDGQHFLLNHYTHDEKGNKKFWYACADKDFNLLWQGEKELPFPDVNSDVHQIALDNSGRILLLTYVFTCSDPSRASDKMCHETHLTVISAEGMRMKDLLVDKDFVSSARIIPKDNGQILVALRYGALTGQPGVLLSMDTAITRLKPTPLVDQRVPAIRKSKLTAFGMPAVEQGKKSPGATRQQKVPDEIVELLPAWNGTVLIEGFRDPEMQVPKGEDIAIRQLHGMLRVSFFDTKDSLRWQRTVDRSFMSTAGEAYGCAAFRLLPQGLVLIYNSTPGGLPAINSAYAEEDGDKKKKDKAPTVEASELHAAIVSSDGKVAGEGSIALPEKGYTFCPMTALIASDGANVWVKGYDRGTQHMYLEFDPRSVLK